MVLSNSKEEDGIPKKLYVGGIPYQYTEDEIRSYFRSCGIITKVDCKMRPEDGAFSGIAYITFETEDGANRALAFDREAMCDQYLTIQQYVPEMLEGGYNRVYIRSLECDTTERDICKLFSDCVINSVRLSRNKKTREFNGCGHVDFEDSASVATALKLDQLVISGRPVRIFCTNPTPPGGETNIFGSYNVEETYTDLNIFNKRNHFATTKVSSGKKRICYECRETGHISTACPKKLQDAKVDKETVNAKSYGGSYMDDTPYTATNEAHSGSLASEVRLGKIKRRTCYECREKGHLAAACLNKKAKF